MAMLDKWWARSLLGSTITFLCIGGIATIVMLAGSQTDNRVLMVFLINLVATVSLQTYMGTSGIISFGHVGFMAIGAYGSALFTANPSIKAAAIPNAPHLILNTSLSFLPAIAIGVAAAVLVAAVIGRVFVKLSGSAAAVATLGFMVVVFTVFSNAEEITRGSKAFSGIPPYTTLPGALIIFAIVLVAARLFRDSDLGLGLRSSSDDAIAAQASGVDILSSRFALWVASAAGSAVAGALYAHYIGAILPKAFHYELTLLLVTMVIVGGRSITGAVVGTALITVLAEGLRRMESGFSLGSLSLQEAPGLTTAALALLIVLTLTIRPAGLLGRWEIDELLYRWIVLRSKSDFSEGKGPRKGRVLGPANT
jgi:branched-chain amino acid transport system permease protein